MATIIQGKVVTKYAACAQEQPLIAREMTLLKLLENKLSCDIPIIKKYNPSSYTFDYAYIAGDHLRLHAYGDFTKAGQRDIAQKLARFAHELHRTIPVPFAQAIGYTTTSWPLDPATLQKYVPALIEKHDMLPFFQQSLHAYARMLAQPYEPVLLHHDMHSNNILVHCTGNDTLKSIIDFADAALGDPFQEFRLLGEIDMDLMDATAKAYAKMAKKPCDLERVHLYYLATRYSRLAEIAQGIPTKHDANWVMTDLLIYAEKYKAIGVKKRSKR